MIRIRGDVRTRENVGSSQSWGVIGIPASLERIDSDDKNRRSNLHGTYGRRDLRRNGPCSLLYHDAIRTFAQRAPVATARSMEETTAAIPASYVLGPIPTPYIDVD